ncbi:MAG: Hpt domain-containing protein, partial [Thermoleophilaceae bacterium]|nr:Hpt domain-containing protein [Thermoleophilaceae bacterium]
LSKPLRAPAVRDVVRQWVRQSPDGPDPTGPGPDGGQAVASNAEPGTGEGPEPILDEAVLADLGDLEPDDLGRLLSLYLEESSSQLAALRQVVGRGEAPTVEQLAHKLKGSSSAIGAARVARVGAALELQAKAGDLGGAEELLDRLESALDESNSAFRSSNQFPSTP